MNQDIARYLKLAQGQTESNKLNNYQEQFQLGKSFRNQGLNQEAIYYFCETIKLNPTYSPAYISLRYIDLKPKKRLQLIDFYQQILVNYPNLSDALANLAELLTQENKMSEAIALSRQAVYHKTISHYPDLAQVDWQFKKEKAPDFIIIGAGKSGTTSLYKYLGYHPQILLSNKKELRFFDKNFTLGYEWYLAQFPTITDQSQWLTGEASPSYLFMAHAAQRIKDLAPNIKLIVMLRNPVERSISDYYQNQKTGCNNQTLEQAIATEIQRIKQQTEVELSYGSGILSQSLYYYKLKRWLKIFPKSQLLIIKSEVFFANPGKSMEQVLDFLGLANTQHHNYQKYNVGDYSEISEAIKEQLAKFFSPYNQQLSEYLQMDFNW
jgi:tetratricopeptide (TPR) repeat protein